MAVLVNEHLSLQYLVQAHLVDKIEVRNVGMLVCKTIKKTRKALLAKKGTRKNSVASININ